MTDLDEELHEGAAVPPEMREEAMEFEPGEGCPGEAPPPATAPLREVAGEESELPLFAAGPEAREDRLVVWLDDGPS